MIETCELTRPAGVPAKQILRNLKLISTLVAVVSLLATWPVHADEPEDHYLRILNVIEQAEMLKTNKQPDLALAKFQKARGDLQSFQKTYPTWNVKVVSYRTKYVADRIAALTAPRADSGATSETGGTKSAAGSSNAQVKVLEAGAEPRKALRLHPKPGDKQTLGLTLKVATDTKLGEVQTPAMKLPEMTMTMEATVKTVSADGDIDYETVITEASVAEDPDVLPQIAEVMKSALSGVKGMAGSGNKSSRGFNKEAAIKLPAGSDPQLHQTMGQMKEAFGQVTVPLPEEAVGPGAKWEVKMPLDSQGMKINQTATYELVSVEGDRVTVKCTVAQSAVKQKVQNPAMPGMKLDLTKMVGTGTGEITLDLSQLMPPQGTIDSHSELSMEMDVGGQKQGMTVKVDVKVRTEAK